jgi:hypothetical protein
MSGRLRLDKVAQYIGEFLKNAKKTREQNKTHHRIGSEGSGSGSCPCNVVRNIHQPSITGPLYFSKKDNVGRIQARSAVFTHETLQNEYISGVPLNQALKNHNGSTHDLLSLAVEESFVPLTRRHTMLPSKQTISSNVSLEEKTLAKLESKPGAALDMQFDTPTNSERTSPAHNTGNEHGIHDQPITTSVQQTNDDETTSMRQQRPLVDRQGHSDLDYFIDESPETIPSVDYSIGQKSPPYLVTKREVPKIPFDELMLIEKLGIGRVSTIYRAAWRKAKPTDKTRRQNIRMLALKVAMVNPETGDTSHIDEMRREADIAARLQHPNISELVGISEDHECFCLAYEYCEGGSLLSLLSDSTRYYEYLPIALDIANGMAYLHSRKYVHYKTYCSFD